jgi:hypothetical protein
VGRGVNSDGAESDQDADNLSGKGGRSGMEASSRRIALQNAPFSTTRPLRHSQESEIGGEDHVNALTSPRLIAALLATGFDHS